MNQVDWVDQAHQKGLCQGCFGQIGTTQKSGYPFFSGPVRAEFMVIRSTAFPVRAQQIWSIVRFRSGPWHNIPVRSVAQTRFWEAGPCLT